MKTSMLERMERIDYLIRIKGTGSPSELARRLNISERNVYQYLNLMKDMGAPIKFCRYRETYFYTEDGQFFICFLPRFRNDEDRRGGGPPKE